MKQLERDQLKEVIYNLLERWKIFINFVNTMGSGVFNKNNN